MLVLSTLHNLLSQILALPELHTAVLMTPEGQLISVACDSSRPKDEIRIVVGLSGEVWQETKEQGSGMVNSELGRILVLPVEEEKCLSEDHEPLMLLALNSTDAVEWEELQTKGGQLAKHLAKPLSRFREHLAATKSPSATTSPDRPTR